MHISCFKAIAGKGVEYLVDYSVSDAVVEVLSEMHFLTFPLQEDLVNYSALARYLKPLVEKRVGEEVGPDAIILAIKKYRESLPEVPFHVFAILAEAKLFLRTGISLIHFERSDALYQRLVDFQHNIDWAAGEKMYLLERSEELSVVVLSKYEKDLLALAKSEKVLKKFSNLALVTMILPPSHIESYGILEYIARQFSDLGVSVKELFTSYEKFSLVFDEKNSSEVYEKLSNAVKFSREVVAGHSKGKKG